MPSPKAIKKLYRNFRDYGFVVTLRKTCSAFLEPVMTFRRYRIYRIRLDRFIPGELDTGGFELRLLNPDEDELIVQIEAMEEWLQGEVRGKLREGSICLVALENDRVAGFNLVSFGKVRMPLVKMTREFRENESWSEQITVGRDYRGRGLASILRLTIFRILKDRGIKRFYGGTLPVNTANRRLSRKVGFREIGDIHYRCILKRKSWAFKRIEKNDETP